MVAALDRFQALAQLHIGRGGAKVGRQIGHAGQQSLEVAFIQGLGVVFVGGECAYRLFHMAAKGLVAHFQPVHADQGEVGRQQIGARQVVQRGHEQALGQVATGAKDDHRAGRCAFAVRRFFVFDVLCHGCSLCFAGFFVAAKLLTHGREHFFCKRVFFA